MDELLTTDELCQLLKVKASFIRDLRSKKRIPFVKLGHLVRYQKSAIQKWVESGQSANIVSPLMEQAIERR